LVTGTIRCFRQRNETKKEETEQGGAQAAGDLDHLDFETRS